MTRDLRRENTALRQRLRETEARLRLLAAAVWSADPAAQPLAGLLLRGYAGTSDGVSREPPSPERGEPEARDPSNATKE